MSRRFSLAIVAVTFCLASACERDDRTADLVERDAVEPKRPQPPPKPANNAPALRDVAKARLITPVPAGEWHLPTGDQANTRYTPLDEIDTKNVGRLKLVSTRATGVARGHEGNPLVVNDTMYVVTPFPHYLLAIDLRDPNGPLKWKYDPSPDPQAIGVACCDLVNRGASYTDGKIIYNLLDAHTVAVDAETGKELWRTKTGEIAKGETTTGAAHLVKDLVLVGNSGGELGVRGKVSALDVDTGEVVWRAYNTGPDEDVLIGEDFKPFYESDRGDDLGVKSWPPDQWELGGSTVWGWFSYDPGADLIYYGTGNPGVWNPYLRPGDNKWSMTIFARDPDDGSARWAHQIIPHDHWDYDEIMENILIDMAWKGEERELLIHPSRGGFVIVMDRRTGEMLSAEKFMPVNWAFRYDLKTGHPVVNPAKKTEPGRTTKDICPSSTGAKEFVPSAFSPRTGLLYIPAHNTCMDHTNLEANYIAGTPYLGAETKMFKGAKTYHGELVAWDLAGEKRAWSVREEKFPVYSGVLATGGDLVFYGTMDGWFKALHAKTGEVLWKAKLSSGIIGNPMTYLGPDGKQYVAIYAGIGGWMGSVAFPTVSMDDPYAVLGAVGAMQGIKSHTAPGGAVYIFGL